MMFTIVRRVSRRKPQCAAVCHGRDSMASLSSQVLVLAAAETEAGAQRPPALRGVGRRLRLLSEA